MKGGLTDQAKVLLFNVIEDGTDDQENPFVYRHQKLYMLFDCIRIQNATRIYNSMAQNTGLLNVCYYWKHTLMNVTQVERINLTTEHSLDLDGFEGAMLINNTDQFTMGHDEILKHMESVKSHLECMTDKQLDVMYLESKKYAGDNKFKVAIVNEIEKRDKGGNG